MLTSYASVMALNRASASGLGGCLSDFHFLTRFLYAARISDSEVSLGRLRILWYSSGGFPIVQEGGGSESGAGWGAGERGRRGWAVKWQQRERRGGAEIERGVSE
jgi:hypothetical protein